jgi:predicted nucleic-acid-binding protein
MPRAVDTNIFVRFLVDDGSKHVALARRVFADGQVFVPVSVMLESEWVLRSNFGFKRDQICDAFERVLGVASITIQDDNTVENAVASCRRGLDFADALHLHSSDGCEVFYTFDDLFIRKAKRATSVPPVRRPPIPKHGKELERKQ